MSDARWQYALANDAGRKGAGNSDQAQADAGKWDWPLDAPLALHVPARSFDWRPTETQALPGRACGRRCNRHHPPHSVRLHEVPDLDVSADGQGVGELKKCGVLPMLFAHNL